MKTDEQMMVEEFSNLDTQELTTKLHHLNQRRSQTTDSSIFHNLSLQIQVLKEVLTDRFEEEDQDSDSLRSMPNSNVVIMLSAMIIKRAQMKEGEQADNLSAHISIVQQYIIERMSA